MKILDSYIIRGGGGAVGRCLGAVVGVVYLGELYAHMEALSKRPVEPVVLGALKLLGDSAWIVPLAGVLGISLFFSQLHRAQELVAMRAAGLGSWRMARSLWVLVLVGVLWVGAVEFWLWPWAQQWQEKLRVQWGIVGAQKTYAYETPDYKERWVLNGLDGQEAQGVSLSLFEFPPGASRREEVQHFFAQRARYDAAQGVWHLERGRCSVFEQRRIVYSTPFETQTIVSGYTTPELLRWTHAKPESLNLRVLWALLRMGHAPHEIQLLIASRLSCLLRPALALVLALWALRHVTVRGSSLKSILWGTGAYSGFWAVSSLLWIVALAH